MVTGNSDLSEKVKELVSEQLGLDESEIKPDLHLLDDLGADSLDIVELIMAIEEEFDIEIPDEDAEQVQTLKDIIAYINDKKV